MTSRGVVPEAADAGFTSVACFLYGDGVVGTLQEIGVPGASSHERLEILDGRVWWSLLPASRASYPVLLVAEATSRNLGYVQRLAPN